MKVYSRDASLIQASDTWSYDMCQGTAYSSVDYAQDRTMDINR